MKRSFRHTKPFLRIMVLCAMLCFFIISVNKKALAADCEECACAIAAHKVTQEFIANAHIQTRTFFGTAAPIPPQRGRGLIIGTGELGRDERWWIDVFLIQNVIPAMQMMTEQLVTVMMNQILAIGAAVDAKQQLETQLLFQKLSAEAHKDYQTSVGMCTIGTTALSLAASERISEMTASVLAEHTVKHTLGNGEMSGAEGNSGDSGDKGNRLTKFAADYCDFDDNDRLETVNNTGLFMVCDRKTHTDATNYNLNRDIDFIRTVADPDTIPVTMNPPFENNNPDPVFAMKQNLYGNDVMQRMKFEQLKLDSTSDEVVDYRTVAAKRSVASSAFETLAGLKASGTDEGAGTGRGSADTLKYMSIIMQNLGIPEKEVEAVLGKRPSYYAQLRFLAKRLYQNPQFYVDLYDTPANVNRKRVALQAINSILEREMYNSSMRSEAMMSQILELHVDKRQSEVMNSLRNLDMNSQ